VRLKAARGEGKKRGTAGKDAAHQQKRQAYVSELGGKRKGYIRKDTTRENRGQSGGVKQEGRGWDIGERTDEAAPHRGSLNEKTPRAVYNAKAKGEKKARRDERARRFRNKARIK